ncbi:MAG TPA: cyclic nucleotide-binding domain-containing protein [Pseudomonadales bacterium]
MEIAALNDRLLENYVPLRALTADHLATLMREHHIDTVLAGKTLFDIGDTDRCYVYLLHGTLEIETATGDARTLSQDALECRFPLAHRQPRACKAVAKTDCSVIRFDAAMLDSMLCFDQAADSIKLEVTEQPELGEEARWILALLDSNLIHKVPPVNLRSIVDCFKARSVKGGEVIVRQGDAADACYYLKRGEATVSVQTDGVEQVVASLPPGRFFGEDALVHDAPRNATVTMGCDGELLTLNKSDFIRLLQRPDCAWIGLGEARQRVETGALWVDVRTQDEFEAGHVPGAFHLPLGLLRLKLRLLDPNRSCIVYCNSGRRSAIAEHLLREAGFAQVAALKNGFEGFPDAERAFFLSESGDTKLKE